MIDLLAVARKEGNAEHQGDAEDDHARTEHAEGVSSAIAGLQHNPGNRNGGQCENKFSGHRVSSFATISARRGSCDI